MTHEDLINSDEYLIVRDKVKRYNRWLRLNPFIIMASIALIAGFLLGRMTKVSKETVKYVKLETIEGYVPSNMLNVKAEFKTKLDQLPLMFWRVDSIIENDTIFIPDTIKVFDDFQVRREYEFTAFDDMNGRLDINSVIQYNRMQSFRYRFTPIQKQTTIHSQKRFEPFIGAGFSPLGINATGGFFYDNIGLQYQYFPKGHGLNLLVKF